MQSIRAWHFGHPDLDRSADQLGMVLSPRNTIQMVEDEAAIRQSVLLLLSTRPGERVMRPDYGCAIHTLAFSPNDETTAALAIHYVRSALLRWEPRIDIRALDAFQHPDSPNTLQISLAYQIRATQATDEIQLDLDLSGA